MGLDIILFDEEPDENFRCAICLSVMENAVCICHHGHSCCAECIEIWREKRTSCPHCREPMFEECVPNRLLNNLIAKLRLKCPNGCEWTGTVGKLNEHRARCEWTPVQCSYLGCPQSMISFPRRDLQEHEQQCEFRPVPCSHCNQILPMHGLETHQSNECSRRPILCPNHELGCPVRIPLDQENAHLEQCEFQPVHCLVPDCNTIIERRNLVRHNHDCAHIHIQRLGALVTELNQTHQQALTQIQTLEREMQVLRQEAWNYFSNRYQWIAILPEDLPREGLFSKEFLVGSSKLCLRLTETETHYVVRLVLKSGLRAEAKVTYILCSADRSSRTSKPFSWLELSDSCAVWDLPKDYFLTHVSISRGFAMYVSILAKKTYGDPMPL